MFDSSDKYNISFHFFSFKTEVILFQRFANVRLTTLNTHVSTHFTRIRYAHAHTLTLVPVHEGSVLWLPAKWASEREEKNVKKKFEKKNRLKIVLDTCLPILRMNWIILQLIMQAKNMLFKYNEEIWSLNVTFIYLHTNVSGSGKLTNITYTTNILFCKILKKLRFFYGNLIKQYFKCICYRK